MKIKYVHAVTSMLLNNRIQFYKDLSNNIEDYQSDIFDNMSIIVLTHIHNETTSQAANHLIKNHQSITNKKF